MSAYPLALAQPAPDEHVDERTEIISLILKFPERSLFVGIVSAAVDELLDFCKGAYHSEGPVAVAVHVYIQRYLFSIQLDLP